METQMIERRVWGYLTPSHMRVSPSWYGTTLPMWNRVGSRPTTRSISESGFRVKHKLAVDIQSLSLNNSKPFTER